MNRSLLLSVLSAAISMGALACGDDPTALTDNVIPGTVGNDGGVNEQNVLVCTQAPVGRSYVGFGGADDKLEASRISEGTGINRARVKPVIALAGEFERAIGKGAISGANFFAAIPAIGIPDARWFEEPTLNAVSTATIFNLAFEGCITYTATDAAFAAAPTAESGTSQCTTMQRKFWQRDARPEEISACSGYATSVGATEKDPRRQWAYVCAAVLTSAGFLSY